MTVILKRKYVIVCEYIIVLDKDIPELFLSIVLVFSVEKAYCHC